MKIIRAGHLGMCFGVRDAITLALDEARTTPLTVFGDLVHNEEVLSNLRARGVQMAQPGEPLATRSVMITAHGASHKAMESVRQRGHDVIEATCPLVHLAHRAVARLAREGCHLVVIGKRDHVEVRGLTEDLDDFDVVLTEGDILELKEHSQFGVVAQTTQPIEKVRHLAACIRHRFPNSEVRFVDTVCQPTKQRQNAAVELAQQSDVMVVVGGSNSNNTRELVKTCEKHCPRVYHVRSAEELQPDWFEAAQTVGLTAGTSTPDSAIDAVEVWLQRLAVKVAERTTVE